MVNKIKVKMNMEKQLSQLMEDDSTESINKEVKNIFTIYYSETAYNLIENILFKIEKLFNGEFPGYNACNTDYHNFEHTLEVFLATARLIDGYNISNQVISQLTVSNMLIGALFHDVGFIQMSWDKEGTGAKYTTTHEERSIEFLEQHHSQFEVDVNDLESINRIISCTKLNLDINSLRFESAEERIGASIVATADLLGQMANRAYLEKLLFLYYEFKEGNIMGFETEFDILKKTSEFYKITLKRMTTLLLGVYKYAIHHFHKRHDVNRNLYMDSIERQLEYLDKIIADETTNFRNKLNRKDIETGANSQQSFH